jgi:hypothetical protein
VHPAHWRTGPLPAFSLPEPQLIYNNGKIFFVTNNNTQPTTTHRKPAKPRLLKPMLTDIQFWIPLVVLVGALVLLRFAE